MLAGPIARGRARTHPAAMTMGASDELAAVPVAAVPSCALRRVELDAAEAMSWLAAEGLTDGLPVVLPEPHLVDRAVAATGRCAGDVLGVLPPQFAPVTIEKVAVCAVMAGCPPDAMRVVVGADRSTPRGHVPRGERAGHHKPRHAVLRGERVRVGCCGNGGRYGFARPGRRDQCRDRPRGSAVAHRRGRRTGGRQRSRVARDAGQAQRLCGRTCGRLAVAIARAAARVPRRRHGGARVRDHRHVADQ